MNVLCLRHCHVLFLLCSSQKIVVQSQSVVMLGSSPAQHSVTTAFKLFKNDRIVKQPAVASFNELPRVWIFYWCELNCQTAPVFSGSMHQSVDNILGSLRGTIVTLMTWPIIVQNQHLNRRSSWRLFQKKVVTAWCRRLTSSKLDRVFESCVLIPG
jgi:hypothetical protein